MVQLWHSPRQYLLPYWGIICDITDWVHQRRCRISCSIEGLVIEDDKSGNSALGRMAIDKQLHGDFEGVSKGQMLTAGTATKGSAGYVAIERFTGTLGGRRGSFMLQHSGTMTRGAPELSVTVVPDSGTDQLVGLAGNMKIDIIDGKHLYDFEYTLGATH